MPLGALEAAWARPFDSAGPSEGGCPAVKHDDAMLMEPALPMTEVGLGGLVALQYCSSTSYQIR